MTTRRAAKRERNQRRLWQHRLNASHPRDVAGARYDLIRTRLEWVRDDRHQRALYQELADLLKDFDSRLSAPTAHSPHADHPR